MEGDLHEVKERQLNVPNGPAAINISLLNDNQHTNPIQNNEHCMNWPQTTIIDKHSFPDDFNGQKNISKVKRFLANVNEEEHLREKTNTTTKQQKRKKQCQANAAKMNQLQTHLNGIQSSQAKSFGSSSESLQTSPNHWCDNNGNELELSQYEMNQSPSNEVSMNEYSFHAVECDACGLTIVHAHGNASKRFKSDANDLNCLDNIEVSIDLNRLSNGFFECLSAKTDGSTPYSSAELKMLIKYPPPIAHYGQLVYQCPLCDYYDQNKANIIEHMNTSADNHIMQCRLCDVILRYEDDLMAHFKSHNIMHPFECSACLHVTKSKQSLDAHVRFAHKQHLNKFACSICGFYARDRSTLHSHKRLYPTFYFQCFCSICHVGVHTFGELRTHWQMHIVSMPQPNESPLYECSRCSCAFILQRDMIDHMARLHGNSDGKRSITCPYCPTLFKSPMWRQRHISVAHQIQWYEEQLHQQRHMGGKRTREN